MPPSIPWEISPARGVRGALAIDSPVRRVIARPMTGGTIRILGLDPGLRRTGWGLLTIAGSKLAYVACGIVASDGNGALAERLKQLHDGLVRVVTDLAPDEVAVEETFVNKDAQATLKLGHARAVALLVPALAGLPVAEYGANQVKKTVVGVGHAEKRQIHAMVRMLLPKADPDSDDAADALAIAITHAHHRKRADLTRLVS
jgi:crossover junction endodeoxyribonuclease RuvC